MKIFGKHYQTIWETDKEVSSVSIIDQRWLPHKFQIVELKKFDDFVRAIKEMWVRGAPLIGVTSAYSLYFALKGTDETNFDRVFEEASKKILETRPTAVNIKYSLDIIARKVSANMTLNEKKQIILDTARNLCREDVENCKKIGEFGFELIHEIYRKKGDSVKIMTHCNAGWLATIDYGTALAPVYFAKERALPVFVWVSETRPRNQGAKLTAFELLHEGIPHSIISDNAAGYLMQKGMVDLVIVGSDRTTLDGDVANKIGTYLKALAAKDNSVPFYVAVPSSSIDFEMENGSANIPIEQRDASEVKYISGLYNEEIVDVLVCPEESEAVNYAFDVTPSRLVDGLITERGICKPNRESLLKLFPEKKI
ncbi:MAG: S-methyl-5-thioribose-1-phosphate isomerase [Ignavibacteria bacterium]|nr:S-methyl-5-thioribose-1-phosphate isomerase [Ignavibacteria bacterium]